MHPIIYSLLAESMWERPTVFGIPLGALFLFWLVMQSLQKGNASSENSRAELRKIRRQQERERRKKESRNRQPSCPFCGGRLEGEYPKCKHCASDLAWRHGKPRRPGDEVHFIPPDQNSLSEKDPSAWKVCARCGKQRFLAMYQTINSAGKLSGPVHSVCSTCRNRDQ